ncbi:MAG: Ig-like domain-containing protein [Gemmatimonadetes bacterium]|nr:Ig-like domain-containing protein [Gemmatimonadota bacterium]
MAGLVAVVAGLSCSDSTAGPRERVQLLLAPQLPAIPRLSKALGIDNFRVIIGTAPDIRKDTTYSFGPLTDSIIVNLVLANTKAGDQLSATIQGRIGSTVLFAGTTTVTARSVGSPAPSAPLPVPVTYVGPGKGLASMTILPRDTSIVFGDSISYRATALDSAGQPVQAFYKVISASDTTVFVSLAGSVRAPARRGTIWVIGTTPTGIKDSTHLTFVPVPVVIKKLLGDNQVAPVGTTLPVPLTVKVQAADSSGVNGVPVTFAALSGGQVTTAIALTDTNGVAVSPVTLGPLTGAQSFTARVGALAPVTFAATANPGTPKTLAIQAGNAQTGAVGAVLPVAPTVIVKDSLGNPVPGVKVTFTKVASSTGKPVNDSAFTSLAGVASSGGWRMGSTPRADTLIAAASVGSVVITATATVAPAVKVLAVSGDLQSAIEGNALTNPLVAKVVDSLGNAISGVTVNFATAAGSLAPTSAVSNASGQVSTAWTLPLGPGTKTATASVTTPAGVTPYTFTATALPVTPTLFVSVIGSNVVGVGRAGTLLIKTSTPVPAGAPLAITLTNGNPSALTLSASTAQIPGADSVITVPVTGVSAGTSTVTASAVGYVSGTLNVPVSLNLISSSATLNVGLGQVTSLPISLTTAAPAGGLSVAVNSLAPTTVFVTTPSVTIAAGLTTGSASVRGDALGSTSIALTNPNYAPFTLTANVTAALKWKPVSAIAYVGGLPAPLDTIQLQSAGVAIPAPAGGVAVTFTSTNTACVANGSGTIPAGSPNLVIPVTYGGTATLPCTAKLAASASAGVTPDSLSITINPKPKLAFTNTTLGRGLQTFVSTFGLPVAQHGGVAVTLQVADSSRVRLSTIDTVLGGGTVVVPVANGQTNVQYYVQALEGKAPDDSVALIASAPGFLPDTNYVLLRNIGLRLDNAPTGGTTTLSARSIISATIGYLSPTVNPTSLVAQNVRAGGAPRNISFISGNPLVARLRGGFTGTDTTTLLDSLTAIIKPVTLATTTSGLQLGSVGLQPIGAGSDTLRLNTTDTTITLVPSLVQRVVPISAPLISTGTATIGRGLQATASYFPLQVGAPAGGTTVTIINPQPALLKLSNTDSTIVGDTLTVPVSAGSTFLQFYIHVLEGTGPDLSDTLKVSAPGYTNGLYVVQLRTAAYALTNLPATTTSLSARTFFAARVGFRSVAANPTIGGFQPLRAQAPTLTFNVVNDSTSVAKLLSNADTTVGADTVTVSLVPRKATTDFSFVAGGSAVAFRPVAGGTTTIRLVPQGSPTFLPGNWPIDTITVTAPTMVAAGNGAVLGRGLQTSVFPAVLGTAAPAGGVTVTITSQDSTRLKLGLTDSTLAGSITFPVAAGFTTGPTFYFHALEGVAANDSVVVSYSAPGYTPVNGRVFLRNVGVRLIGVPSTTTTLSAPPILQAQVGYINNPTDTVLASGQALRAQAPVLNVNVLSRTPSVSKLLTAADSITGVDSVVVQLKQRQNTSPNTLLAGGVKLRPLTSGVARLAKSAQSPNFKPLVSSFADTTTFTAPAIGASGPFTVGAGLQQLVSFVSLGAPAPAGTVITLKTSDPTLVKLAANDSTPGVDSLTIPVSTGFANFSYYIQGIENGSGTATVTLSANGYSQATHIVNVVQPAVALALTTTATSFQRTTAVAVIGIPSGSSVTQQPLRAGGPGPITVNMTSANPGVLSLLSPADTLNGLGAISVQIAPRQTSTSSAISQVNYTAGLSKATGTSLVTASIAGYQSTVNAAQTVTVTTPSISAPSRTTVGAGLQVQQNAFLGSAFHFGKTVTITSADPAKLLVAPNDSTPGAASITVNVPDRLTTIPYFVQGVPGQVGNVTITISAPGFNSATVSDSVAQPMVEITSSLGSATAGTADRAFTVRVGLPDSPTSPSFITTLQAVRWDAATPTPLTVSLGSSNAASVLLVNQATSGGAANLTVNIAPKSTTSPNTVAAGGVAWRPVASGTSNISATAAGYLVTPTTSTRVATVP